MANARRDLALDAVLFDVDGTLLDSVPAIVIGLRDLVHEVTGRRPSESYARGLIGTPLREQFRIYGFPDAEGRCAEYTARAMEIFDRHASMETPFGPAVEGFLELVRAGVPTAFVTSKSRPEYDGFAARYDFSSRVRTAVTASDVLFPKPHAMPVELACRRLDVRPDRAALVGDSVHDLRSARSAGAYAVAVGYGSGDPGALLAENPDLYFPAPEDVRDWCADLAHRSSCPARKLP